MSEEVTKKPGWRGKCKEMIAQNGIVLLAALMLMIGGWAGTFIKDFFAKPAIAAEHHEITSEGLKDRNRRDLEVQTILTTLTTQLDADRTVLYSLHNGAYWSTGEPMIKYTAAYESDAVGVAQISQEVQNVLISSNPKVGELLTHEDVMASDITTETEPVARNRMYYFGIKSWAAKAVRVRGTPIGFIAVQFVHDHHQFTKAETDRIEIASARIAEIFSRKAIGR